MSNFSGIGTALTALQAHRRAMDVTGHNIANVNTAGYTRQRVDLRPIEAPGTGSMVRNMKLTGSGVEVAGTSRLADEFLTARVRSQTASHAELQAKAETLTQVERLLAEPGENGLAQQLSQMWNAWSNLGNNPDSLAAKTVLLDKTQAVIDSVKAGHRSVEALWTDQRGQVDALVTEVNGLTGQIAELNGAILAASKDGAANEMLDQRDQLVTKLVELTGATAVPTAGGQVTVYLDGNPAVTGVHSYQVKVAGPDTLGGVGYTPASAGPPPVAAATAAPVRLAWVDGSAPSITLAGGQLTGALDSLNTALPKAAAGYDAVARALTETINAAYTGGPPDFLRGTTATSLELVSTDPAVVRAGPGLKDGSVALAVSQRRTAAGGPDEVWQKHVVSTGVSVQAAVARADVVAGTLKTAVADQQAATGVSLDEETANLLMIQRAYEGAARVLTAVDEALDVLINRTGLVGR